MESFDFQTIPVEEGERWLKKVFKTHDSPDEITEILLTHNVSLVDVIAICGEDAGTMYTVFRPVIAMRKFRETHDKLQLNKLYGSDLIKGDK